MLTMRAADPLVLTDEQRKELERIARSTSAAHRTVLQAKALLAAGDGVANNEIARSVGVSADSVRAWRKRFRGERCRRDRGHRERAGAAVVAAGGHGGGDRAGHLD